MFRREEEEGRTMTGDRTKESGQQGSEWQNGQPSMQADLGRVAGKHEKNIGE